jgi:GNAT superfamily N-acetyltransferase
MSLQIVEQSPSFLPQYATIPIAFEVREKLDLHSFERHDPNLAIRSIVVDPPFEKDYDAIAGQHPLDWPERFDLSNWTFAAAFESGALAGGMALIVQRDEAVIWDIRVTPTHRRRGIGRNLMRFAESVALRQGLGELTVETQDINVTACRFYAADGYQLRSANHFAHPQLPHEVQLIWSKQLIRPRMAAC